MRPLLIAAIFFAFPLGRACRAEVPHKDLPEVLRPGSRPLVCSPSEYQRILDSLEVLRNSTLSEKQLRDLSSVFDRLPSGCRTGKVAEDAVMALHHANLLPCKIPEGTILPVIRVYGEIHDCPKCVARRDKRFVFPTPRSRRAYYVTEGYPVGLIDEDGVAGFEDSLLKTFTSLVNTRSILVHHHLSKKPLDAFDKSQSALSVFAPFLHPDFEKDFLKEWRNVPRPFSTQEVEELAVKLDKASLLPELDKRQTAALKNEELAGGPAFVPILNMEIQIYVKLLSTPYYTGKYHLSAADLQFIQYVGGNPFDHEAMQKFVKIYINSMRSYHMALNLGVVFCWAIEKGITRIDVGTGFMHLRAVLQTARRILDNSGGKNVKLIMDGGFNDHSHASFPLVKEVEDIKKLVKEYGDGSVAEP